MFNLLLKSGLSLALLSSLTISSSGSCTANMQHDNSASLTGPDCCPSHVSPGHHPVKPASSDDCQCRVMQVAATSKSRLPAPETGISTLHDPSLPIPSGQTTFKAPTYSQANSRPLYLLHCVWIC